MPPHNPPALVIDNTHRVIAVPLDYDRSPEPDTPVVFTDYVVNRRLDGPARRIVIGAMPAARAADASHSSLLRVSTIGGIAIAAFALVYFGLQLVRGAL